MTVPSLPAWVRQNIAEDEAQWLGALIAEVKPRRVVEIGVGSGWSSAIILLALAENGNGGTLESFNIERRCSWDRDKPIGGAVDELVPREVADRWKLHLGCTAKDAARSEKFDFAFIDACHRHPWPCWDLLQLLPVLAPNSWVAFHDLRLPDHLGGEGQSGAKFLFNEIQGVDKRHLPTGFENIGAIHVPLNPELLRGEIMRIVKTGKPEGDSNLPTF